MCLDTIIAQDTDIRLHVLSKKLGDLSHKDIQIGGLGCPVALLLLESLDGLHQAIDRASTRQVPKRREFPFQGSRLLFRSLKSAKEFHTLFCHVWKHDLVCFYLRRTRILIHRLVQNVSF